jgi:hypothetical protein
MSQAAASSQLGQILDAAASSGATTGQESNSSSEESTDEPVEEVTVCGGTACKPNHRRAILGDAGLEAIKVLPGYGFLECTLGANGCSGGEWALAGVDGIPIVGAEITVVKTAVTATKAARATTRVTGDALKAARKEFESLKPSLWRQEAATNPGRYSPSQLADMRAGRGPLGSDGFRMELHHRTPLANGGTNSFDNMSPLTRTDHRLGENYGINHPGLP